MINKKVLLIDSKPGGHWSLDLLFSGLVNNLGHHRVVDWPPHHKHVMGEPSREFNGNLEHDWGAERRSMSYVEGWELIPRYTLNDIHAMFAMGEISVVFIDEREQSFRHYVETRAKFFDVPVVLVSSCDSFENVSPSWVNENYFDGKVKLAFLDNWIKEYDNLKFARPYNLSINFDHTWNGVSDYEYEEFDISFVGYMSNPDRGRFIDHVNKNWKMLNNKLILERNPHTFDRFVLRQEYYSIMKSSKLCLDLNGNADDGHSYRYYEIPYAGSCMLTQRMKGKQIDKFVDGIHCLEFSCEDELDECISEMLKNSRKRRKIAKEGHRFAIEKHTAKARVAWMLNELEKVGVKC